MPVHTETVHTEPVHTDPAHPAARHTQPLRDEHRELRPHIDELVAVADLLDDHRPGELGDRLAAASSFVNGHLLRHAGAEEAALYPVVGRAMGSTDATATMSRDHREIAAFGERLAQLVEDARGGRGDTTALRRVLYGLHAIVALHFAKEEEVYLPLLDERLTPEEAARLFAGMEAAAAASE